MALASRFRAIACVGILLIGLCSAARMAKGAEGRQTQGSSRLTDAPPFREVAEKVGLDFVHFNGMSGELYFPEMTGQGGALFDYDGDGDLDVYVVQGAMLGLGKTLSDAVFPWEGETPPRDRLFRNERNRDPGVVGELRFTDVTRESGILAVGYGMGVATGDFDNDGVGRSLCDELRSEPSAAEQG